MNCICAVSCGFVDVYNKSKEIALMVIFREKLCLYFKSPSSELILAFFQATCRDGTV